MTEVVRGRDGLRLVPEEFVLFDEVMGRLDLIAVEHDEVEGDGLMQVRMSGVLLFAGFLLAAVAFGRGRVDGVALLAVVAVLSALVRWLWEVSHVGN